MNPLVPKILVSYSQWNYIIPIRSPFPITKKKDRLWNSIGKKTSICDFPGPKRVYSTLSPISRAAKVCECDSIWRPPSLLPYAHSVHTVTKAEEGLAAGSRGLCLTHLSKSKCSSPVSPNAPISQQRSSECKWEVMLWSLFHGIEPTQIHFFSHALALYLWHTRTQWGLGRKQP